MSKLKMIDVMNEFTKIGHLIYPDKAKTVFTS